LKQLDKPLSSDCFTGFGRHDFAIHHEEARQATRHLVEVVIPSFIRKLEAHEFLPVHSHQLTQAMHQHGINMRYLGVIRAGAKDPMLRGLTAVEMITRSAKSVIRQRMRKCESDFALRQVLVDHFNLVLGKSQPSKIYWNLMIKVHLLEKYGAYNVPIWTQEEARDLQSYVSRIALFKTLQAQLGVRFHPHTDDVIEVVQNAPSDTVGVELQFPLHVEDVLEITVRCKRLCESTTLVALYQQKLADIAKVPLEQAPVVVTHGRRNNDDDDEQVFMRQLQVVQEQRQRTSALFGASSGHTLALDVQLAWMWFEFASRDEQLATRHQADVERAFEDLNTAMASASRVPLEVLVGASYLQGVASESKGQWLRAESYYLRSIRELQRLTGGRNVRDVIGPMLREAAVRHQCRSLRELRLEPDEMQEIERRARTLEATHRTMRQRGDWYNERQESQQVDYHAKAGHPFAMVVLNRLVGLLCTRGRANGTVAIVAALEFYRLWKRYFVPAPDHVFQRVFGSSTPVALTYVTCHTHTTRELVD